jgi:hypothetical protein
MSVEYRPGGRRRIDRVLDPAFLQGLGGLTDEALRERRDDAQQEEVDLSYLRRLLHGRLDMLEDERAHRTGERPAPLQGAARSDAEIAEVLARVLADESRATRGSGRFLTAEPSRVGETRREAERIIADVGLSAPGRMGDQELAGALERLRAVERAVSGSRRAVQGVEQALTDELSRRLQRVS